MRKITIKCCIRKEMEKGDGTAREIHQRVTADPAVRKRMKGKEISLQTVATTLHTGDVKRNPRGWCTSSGGRPLRYSLTETANVSTQASATTPDVLERLMVALLPAIAGAMQICLQVLTARTNPAPGTTNLADVLASAEKNSSFPAVSATGPLAGQLRA